MTDPDNSLNNLLNGSATSSVRRDGNAGLSRGGSGNYDRRQPDQTRFVPSLRNSFPQRNRYRGTEAEGYAHDCLPLGLRDNNVMTMSQNPSKITTLSTKSNGCNNGRALRAGNLLGNNGHNVRSFATSRSDLLCEVKEESCNITNGTSNQISQMSSPSLQTLNLCTFTPGRNCPDSRWAQPVHNRLMTPVVSPYNQFSAANDAPAHTQIINPSGSHMTNHNHNEFDTKRDHLFKEPSLPRHPDWSHFKTVPSIAPSTFNESDNASQSIPLTCSAASHCNTCSNPSYFQGNDIESCPSRLTSPMHSAYSRKTRKRALSISPFLSEGLDLNSIIRLSPTSLFTCLLSRHSSTSGSPQPVQQGSFSHLTARNTSPYSQHGSGQRGFGENTAPFSTELSENNLMEEIMRNAFVATKDDMPYVEQNYYSWNIHDDSAGIQNRPANGYQKCCCVTYANSQVGNVTSAAQSNCTVSGRTDSFFSSTNEAMGRHNNSGICIANVEPPVSFSCGAHHQRHPHCIHQTHTHNHYLQQQQHHMACKSPSQAAFPSSCHVQQHQQQLKAEPSALEVYNLDKFDQMAISCVDRHMPASSHVVDSFSPGELQQVNGLSVDAADSSIPSINMDNVFSYEDSTQREGSVAGHGECDGDHPMICRWKDCNLMFGNQRELVVHLKMHVDQTTDDEFTCLWENCKRNCDPFNARYKMVIHLRVHSKEQPHKCMADGCTKAFSRLENLKIHLRSHTGERPYVCEHPGCRRAFSNSSDRAKHKKTHIDTRPYVCQTSGCGKRYTDPSSLRKHAKSHSREQQQQQQQHQQSQKQHHQQSRKQHHQQSQQKKKLKKETQGGGDIFNTCLSIQKLKPGGASTERSDLVTSPHTGSNNDIFQSFGLPRSVSSQCGTVSATSNMSIQQSPGTLEVLEEASESMPLNSASGFSSALSPLTLPPIPHQMRPSASGVYGGKYGTNHEMFPLSHVTALPPITQQQQQLIPHYPQNFTSFNSCRVGAMQAQRMMQFPGFHPEAFNLPLNGLAPSGFSDASSFATLEALGAPNEVSMQEYLQLSAIDRGNSHTSIYADGST